MSQLYPYQHTSKADWNGLAISPKQTEWASYFRSRRNGLAISEADWNGDSLKSRLEWARESSSSKANWNGLAITGTSFILTFIANVTSYQ